jgi:hypothetical protein
MPIFETSIKTLGHWKTYIYKEVDLLYPSGTEANISCTATCYFDDGPCYIAVWENNKCYLGDWNVNSNMFSISATAANIRTRERSIVHKKNVM